MKSSAGNGNVVPVSYGAVAENVVIDEHFYETQPLNSVVTPAVVVAGDDDRDPSPHCRDPFFAVLFWAHMIIMVWLGLGVAPAGYENIHLDFAGIEDEIRKSDDVTDEDLEHVQLFIAQMAEYVKVYPWRILLYLVFPCCILAFTIAFFVTVFVVKPFPKTVVYSSLLGSLSLTALIMISSSLASGSVFVFLLTGAGLAAVIYYISIAWRMVPFAAVNLKVALEGMSRNCGIYLVGFLCAELGFVWVVFWIYTLTGVMMRKNVECQAAHPDSNFDITSDEYDDVCDPPFGVVVLFLLSLYWTSTIIMNTIQVTVAGVMATWCFAKQEADNCCSSAVFSSLYRSLTFSFGSICLGSLLQAVVSLFRYLVETARNNRDRDDNACGNILLCILDCLARLLEDVIEYFSQWAYCFIGIYGYSYLESGKRVWELFKARGWTTIITDNLVGYVLGFVTFTNGLLTGAAGVLVEGLVSKHFHDPNPEFDSYLGLNRFATFAIGFVIGIWVCSIMMNVVKGAVNTLIVCWADSPAVMEAEHPVVTKEMADAWTAVFPDAAVRIRPAYAVVV